MNGALMDEPVLNWIPRFDERSREFPIRAAIPTRPRKRNKFWTPGPILDQGREGACVGFGWAAETLASPVRVDLSRVKEPVPLYPNAYAKQIYSMAKKVDEWEGEDYEGSSVLAGAKAVTQLGLLKEYRWAFSINDVVDALIVRGPVVLGIWWHEGMYEAPNGIVVPEGRIVGGHCITAVGFKLASPKLDGEDGIILQNSWGVDWGNRGLAEIRVSQLAALLDNDGEACVPYRRSYGR